MILDVLKDYKYSDESKKALFLTFSQGQKKAFNLKTRVLQKSNYQCHYCKKPLDYLTVTAEHLIPRSRGGGSTIDNLVAACAPCNNNHVNPLDESREPGPWVSIAFPHA